MRSAIPLGVGAGLVLTGCAAGGTAREPVDPQPASPTVAVSADRDAAQFSLADYTYVLGRDCFCANRGLRYRVAVRDGKVVRVEHAETVRDHPAGEPAPGAWPRLTIHDVILIAKARDSESEWPAGQPYPDLVIENADQADVDGATWYTISAVTELHAARDLASWSLTGSWGPSPGPVEGVSGVRAGHAVGPLAPSPCAIAGSE
jgi:hypothetical protein